MKKLNVQINEIIDAYKYIKDKRVVKINEFLSKYNKDILTALIRINWVYTGQFRTNECVPIFSSQSEDCVSVKYPPFNDKALQKYEYLMKRINDVITFDQLCKNKNIEKCEDKLEELESNYFIDLERDEKGNITKIIPRWYYIHDDENSAENNANSNSKNYIEKTSNKTAVAQLAVPQPIINNSANSLSLGHTLASNESSNNVWHREKILNLLKQNRELREQVEILDLLERIKKEGLVGNDEIKFRVSASFKELYNKYYAPKKPTFSPKLQVIREAIFRIILDDLILSGKIDAETLTQVGFEVSNLDEVKKAERVVYIPILQKEQLKNDEKHKDELKRDEFKQKFEEFEKFLNELIFTQDNLINNAYLVTKPLTKKLFEYIEELVKMDSTPPEAKQLLREMEEYLTKYPLAEKNFKNGIASIPTGVHKQEITPRLTKIEKLLS